MTALMVCCMISASVRNVRFMTPDILVIVIHWSFPLQINLLILVIVIHWSFPLQISLLIPTRQIIVQITVTITRIEQNVKRISIKAGVSPCAFTLSFCTMQHSAKSISEIVFLRQTAIIVLVQWDSSHQITSASAPTPLSGTTIVPGSPWSFAPAAPPL